MFVNHVLFFLGVFLSQNDLEGGFLFIWTEFGSQSVHNSVRLTVFLVNRVFNLITFFCAQLVFYFAHYFG